MFVFSLGFSMASSAILMNTKRDFTSAGRFAATILHVDHGFYSACVGGTKTTACHDKCYDEFIYTFACESAALHSLSRGWESETHSQFGSQPFESKKEVVERGLGRCDDSGLPARPRFGEGSRTECWLPSVLLTERNHRGSFLSPVYEELATVIEDELQSVYTCTNELCVRIESPETDRPSFLFGAFLVSFSLPFLAVGCGGVLFGCFSMIGGRDSDMLL